MGEGIIDKVVDRVFSIRKNAILLILILILAFVLRFIAAGNIGVGADDMHHTVHAINFLESGKLVTYDQSSGLWHSFTSVVYKFFGMTQLTSRFASLLFGSLSVIVIYLLSKEFFNEKISLIAAFLLAISPFHIKSTMAEMDVMVMFFVLMGMVLFIKAMKSGKVSYYIISGLFLGLSLYTKVYPLLFVPSLLMYFVYYKRKMKRKIVTKDNMKKLFLFLFFAGLFAVPTLTHNYLLYQDKGFMDLIFTRFTGLGAETAAQYYSWDSSFGHGNSWKGLFFGDVKHIPEGTPLLLGAINFLKRLNPISFYLGILGIIMVLFFKRASQNHSKFSKDYLMFFFLGILLILPFLASSVLLPKHYLFLDLLIIPLAALAIKKIDDRLGRISKDSLIYVLLLLGVVSLIFLAVPANGPHFYSKNNVGQMIDFKDASIPGNALVVADSRMYRGRIYWSMQGRSFMEGSNFISAISQADSLPGETVGVEVYYFECVPDDCGWGTVKNQPEFNSSMESLADLFKQNGQVVKTMTEGDKDKVYFPFVSSENEIDYIRVYKANLQLKESIFSIANQPKIWFLYPIGYDPVEANFDYYTTHNFIGGLVDKVAHWIVILAVILAFLSPLYVVFLFNKR